MIMISGLWNAEPLISIIRLAEQKYPPENITVLKVSESTLRADMDWPGCVFHLPP